MLDLVRPLLDVTPTISSVCPATLFCITWRFYSSSTYSSNIFVCWNFFTVRSIGHIFACFLLSSISV